MPDEQKVAKSPDEEATKAEQERVRQFLTLAKERFHKAEEAESQNRRDSLDDLDFRIGKQWPADIQTQRVADGRPCLTINRIPQFVRQVTNEQRQNRPAILVSPVGSQSDVAVAEAIQGIIRHIEVISDYDIAIDTAFEACVTGGFGHLRLVTEYIDQPEPNDPTVNRAFDQEIKIRRVKNPFSIYFDPSCIEADYSDARWAFVVEDLSAEEYKAQYPNSTYAGISDFSGVGNQAPGWATKETIRIAEYFRVEEIRYRLVRLADGVVMGKDVYDRIEDKPEDPKPAIEAEREVVRRQVKWAKINATEILEEKDWSGLWIPIIPVLGDDLDVDGKRYLAGLVRNAKDAQRMYNYWESAATEMVALAPKSPFIVAEGQIENHEEEWRTSNVRNLAVLQYKPVTVAGQLAPPPQRQFAEPPIQAISGQIKQAENDLKSTTGLYDPSLGAPGPEQSGRAILARQRQGNIATLNFGDNLTRSIRFMGRQILDLIPKIYDAPRIQRIIRPDQTTDRVGIFNSQSSGLSLEEAKLALGDPAISKIYDVGVGRYDISISSGPSYQSKRQEAVDSILSLVQAYPNIMAFVGDLLVRQMDWPYAQEIADRLKKMLPEQLQDTTDQDPAAVADRLRKQLALLSQQHEALVKELNAASEDIRTRKLEVESKERINALQVQSQLAIAESKIHGDAALRILTAMIADVQRRLDLLNQDKPVAEEPAPIAPAGGVQ